MSLRDQLKGTGVALVTPFNEDSSVDYNSLQNLINFVINDGVQYVVTLGTTGETPTLTTQEKTEIINFTYEAVAGRVPVVVGVGSNSTAAVLKELETLPLEKAVAILSASPYYNKPSQEGIYQHYKAIAEATVKPILLYNVPGRTGSKIAPRTALRLANDFENINGYKEAGNDLEATLHLMRDKPQDFLVVSGDDHLTVAHIAIGMRGVISVAANSFPKDVSAMVQAAMDYDFTAARGLSNRLLQGFDLMFAENNPAGVKAILAEMGLIKNNLRLPLVPLSQQYVEEIKSYLPTLK